MGITKRKANHKGTKAPRKTKGGKSINRMDRMKKEVQGSKSKVQSSKRAANEREWTRMEIKKWMSTQGVTPECLQRGTGLGLDMARYRFVPSFATFLAPTD